MADPLSVTSAVVGLLAAGAKLSSCLASFVSHVRDAPSLAQSTLQEITDIAAALNQLHTYLHGHKQASTERGSLILLENLLATLTGCVTTFSDLQHMVDKLAISENMRIFDRMMWSRKQDKIYLILQRLQNHKASLALMLTILQWYVSPQSFQNRRSSILTMR
jgi:hypothetical protein